MNAEEVARRVAQVAAATSDPEAAHSLRDALYRDVLAAISAGAPDAMSLAAAALKAEEIEFDGWCA